MFSLDLIMSTCSIHILVRSLESIWDAIPLYLQFKIQFSHLKLYRCSRDSRADGLRNTTKHRWTLTHILVVRAIPIPRHHGFSRAFPSSSNQLVPMKLDRVKVFYSRSVSPCCFKNSNRSSEWQTALTPLSCRYSKVQELNVQCLSQCSEREKVSCRHVCVQCVGVSSAQEATSEQEAVEVLEVPAKF